MQVLAASKDLWSIVVILCMQIWTDPSSKPLQKKKKPLRKPTLENQILCRLGAKTLLKLIGINGHL